MRTISFCRKKLKTPDNLVRVKKEYDDARKDFFPTLISRDGIPCNALQECCNHMVASIKNNIKLHFFKRQFKYIMLRDGLNKKDTKKKQQEINNQIGDTTDNSLPFRIYKGVEEDLENYPERFLYPMWIMNNLFISKETWTFSLLPISKGFIPSSVLSLDTSSLSSLISSKDSRLRDYKQKKK